MWEPGSSLLQAHLPPSDTRPMTSPTSVQGSHTFNGPAQPSQYADWQWYSLSSHLQINPLAGKLWPYSCLHPPNTYYTYKWFLNKPMLLCILTASTVTWKLRTNMTTIFCFPLSNSSAVPTQNKPCCYNGCAKDTGLLLQLRAVLLGWGTSDGWER